MRILKLYPSLSFSFFIMDFPNNVCDSKIHSLCSQNLKTLLCVKVFLMLLPTFYLYWFLILQAKWMNAFLRSNFFNALLSYSMFLCILIFKKNSLLLFDKYQRTSFMVSEQLFLQAFSLLLLVSFLCKQCLAKFFSLWLKRNLVLSLP